MNSNLFAQTFVHCEHNSLCLSSKYLNANKLLEHTVLNINKA